MIIESPAALKLVAALTEIGVSGATREYLIKKADISTSTFYRLIGPLIENALVRSDDARYALVLENPYCFRFKLWHDMERLYGLPVADRDMVLGVASAIRSNKGAAVRTLWLVGSGARNELEVDSDLDFLLVTANAQSPIAGGLQRRHVAIIQKSEQEFNDAIHKADGFVVSALQSGIVLIDDGFAQPFYVSPPPVRITSQQARAEEGAALEYRERVLQQLESGDWEQARAALRSQGMHVGRLLLRAFGALPASRPQLVEASREYFGERWARTLSDAILNSPLERGSAVLLSRQIVEQHELFQNQADHLLRFAPLVTSPERDLVGLCARLFEELRPDSEIRREEGADLRVIEKSGREYFVEMKSSREILSEATIERAVRNLERVSKSSKDAGLLLVTNSWVGGGPFEPVVGLYEGRARVVASKSARKRLMVLSGLQLLRAHNRCHLEELEPAQVWEELLAEGLPRQQRNTPTPSDS